MRAGGNIRLAGNLSHQFSFLLPVEGKGTFHAGKQPAAERRGRNTLHAAPLLDIRSGQFQHAHHADGAGPLHRANVQQNTDVGGSFPQFRSPGDGQAFRLPGKGDCYLDAGTAVRQPAALGIARDFLSGGRFRHQAGRGNLARAGARNVVRDSVFLDPVIQMDAENIVPEAVGATIELVRKRHSGKSSSRRVYLDFNPIIGGCQHAGNIHGKGTCAHGKRL